VCVLLFTNMISHLNWNAIAYLCKRKKSGTLAVYTSRIVHKTSVLGFDSAV